MSMRNKQELQKTIDIAKEFIDRARDLVADIEMQKATEDSDWHDRKWVSNRDSAAVRRQSMELTRQLAILRRR